MSEIYIDKTLYFSRPDPAGRLEKEIEAYNILEKLGIQFERVDHGEASSIEDLKSVEDVLGIKICKNLFLCNASRTKFYLLLMPGDKKFLTKNLSKQIESSRLSFAEGDHMEKYLKITPGSVSILGLMNDAQMAVSLVIDRETAEQEYLGCHPLINTSTLKIKTSDIINVFLPYTGHDYKIVDL
nr:prolyl-tRNA synthetase associated domain-containing protein [Sedimentibacter sp.]